MLATSLEEMLTNILDLREKHSKLAEQFSRLQHELEPSVMRNISSVTRQARSLIK